MADRTHPFWTTDKARSREEVRKSLRVVKGGKAPLPSQSDSEGLESDPFLREHYLEGRRRPARYSDPWRSFFMGSFDDSPPDAG
jgi:hypothetical protein